MKKLLATILSVLMLISLTACGEQPVPAVTINNTAVSGQWETVSTTAEPTVQTPEATMTTAAPAVPETTVVPTTMPVVPETTVTSTTTEAPTVNTNPPDDIRVLKGLDLQMEIDNFVEGPGNNFILNVGEKEKPISAVWTTGGNGAVYSNNTNVATVAPNGTITAVGSGTAYVVIMGSANIYQVIRVIVL